MHQENGVHDYHNRLPTSNSGGSRRNSTVLGSFCRGRVVCSKAAVDKDDLLALAKAAWETCDRAEGPRDGVASACNDT